MTPTPTPGGGNRPPEHDDPDATVDHVAPQSSPSQRASRREQAVLLADALGRLPEDYREVIILHHLEGLKFPEVARRMGKTDDSVQKLWVRALASLRRSLEGAP